MGHMDSDLMCSASFQQQLHHGVTLAPVSYTHLSADENSLDGIVVTDKKIAFIDGTSPHIIDPITPGAVDSIINFGDFWNDKKIADQKEDIISYNEECSRWYKICLLYTSNMAVITS